MKWQMYILVLSKKTSSNYQNISLNCSDAKYCKNENKKNISFDCVDAK